MKELSKNQENLIEAFKEYLRKKNMSENTERAYIRTVRQLLFASEDLSEDSLRKYRNLLIYGYQPATINQRVFAVNHFLLFLE